MLYQTPRTHGFIFFGWRDPAKSRPSMYELSKASAKSISGFDVRS
jgi:hypothetical protein